MKNKDQYDINSKLIRPEGYAKVKTMCKTDQRHLDSLSGDLFFENLNEWLNANQAAAYLKLDVHTLRNLVCNGTIPQYKLGNRSRFRLDDLRNLLLSNKKGGSL